MNIIYNKIIPFKGYKCLNLFGIIFARKEYEDELTLIDLRHELIHSELIKELWYIGFYLLYLWYYLKGLCKFLNHTSAYYAIPFEREAYRFDKNSFYLEERPKFAWKAFI